MLAITSFPKHWQRMNSAEYAWSWCVDERSVTDGHDIFWNNLGRLKSCATFLQLSKASWVVSGIRKFHLAVVLESIGRQFSSKPFVTKRKCNYGHYTTRCVSVLINSVHQHLSCVSLFTRARMRTALCSLKHKCCILNWKALTPIMWKHCKYTHVFQHVIIVTMLVCAANYDRNRASKYTIIITHSGRTL